MYVENMLDLIGNTPLISFEKMMGYKICKS